MFGKVGVLIPVYNTAEYLSECVQSVRQQSYGNIQIYMVDDCSTDESWSVIRKLAADHSDITIGQHEANLGWAASYNTVANWAIEDGCDYVMILGSDDKIHPMTVSKMVARLKSTNAHYVVTEGRMFGEDHQLMTAGHPEDYKDFYLTNLLPNFVMFKKGVWEEMDGYDEEFSANGGYADWELWIRLFKAGKKVEVIREPLYQYRMHSAQVHKRADHNLQLEKIRSKHF